MIKNQDEEEYEFSAASEGAIRFWWPETLTPDSWHFEQDMRSLQIELISAHMYLMGPKDKERAVKTILELRAQNKKALPEVELDPLDAELRELLRGVCADHG